jgi:Fe-S cluster assembly protein SufD
MTDVLAYYQKHVQGARKSQAILEQVQEEGARLLTELGFPQRYHEDWKYTSMKHWSEQRYSEAKQPSTFHSTPGVKDVFGVELTGGAAHFDAKKVPEGLTILTLEQAAQDHPNLLALHLGKIAKTTHGFQALNAAMLSSGLVLYVADNTTIEQPIYFSHSQSQENALQNWRHLVVLGNNSRMTLIEDFDGANDVNYFTNSVMEVKLSTQAYLEHYKIQRESKAATHIAHMAIQQDRMSELSHHSINIGGKLVRSDVQVEYRQEEAKSLLNGVYAPHDGQHMDHHIRSNHHVGLCYSEQNYKGILSGHSRAVFNGTVFVEKDAQKTESHQQNKNLLLSKFAEIDTKPQLEIFADDVICSHGATVGQLDEEALFYLATRGIDNAMASQFLIHAFAAEVFKRMPNQHLAEWMQGLLDQQME